MLGNSSLILTTTILIILLWFLSQFLGLLFLTSKLPKTYHILKLTSAGFIYVYYLVFGRKLNSESFIWEKFVGTILIIFASLIFLESVNLTIHTSEKTSNLTSTQSYSRLPEDRDIEDPDTPVLFKGIKKTEEKQIGISNLTSQIQESSYVS